MLLLTRRSGQSITIQPEQGMDVATPVGTLFSDGPIEISVNWIMPGKVSIGIAAHRQLCILRNELLLHDSFPVDISVNNNWRDSLARNVFALRVKHKWSTQQLADKSQLAFTTICALERGLGFIELDDLDRLASALVVSVGLLLKD